VTTNRIDTVRGVIKKSLVKVNIKSFHETLNTYIINPLQRTPLPHTYTLVPTGINNEALNNIPCVFFFRFLFPFATNHVHQDPASLPVKESPSAALIAFLVLLGSFRTPPVNSYSMIWQIINDIFENILKKKILSCMYVLCC